MRALNAGASSAQGALPVVDSDYYAAVFGAGASTFLQVRPHEWDVFGALQALDPTLNATFASRRSPGSRSPRDDDDAAVTASAGSDPAVATAAAVTAAADTPRLSFLGRSSQGEPQWRINALPVRHNASRAHVSPAALRVLEQRRLAAAAWWRDLRDEVRISTLNPAL